MKRPAGKALQALAAALLLAGLCAGCGTGGGTAPEPTAAPTAAPGRPAADDNADWQSTVEWNGTTYQRRRDLKTVLFLGVDNTNLVQAQGEVVGNNGRSDIIMLFILDPAAQTTQTLAVSRDTMAEVDVYKGNGEYAYSAEMQITMQYSYGNSDLRSCFLTKRAVSRLLYEAPITGYLALKMDGIPLLVEELGGITVTFPEDYSYIKPEYVAGAQVTLDGPAAEQFVRERDTTVFGTAEQRLERDTWFMHEVFSQLKAKGDLGQTMQHLLDVAGDSVETDLDAETLQMLADYTMLDETLKVPGTSTAGAAHEEYYVDEAALQKMVIELFYEPAT